MAINQRQFDQLTEMGIDLWQHKSANVTHYSSRQGKKEHNDNALELNDNYLSDLSKQKTFSDILQSVDISIGEIIHKKDHLDLGIFNWYFYAENHDELAISCKNNNLYSPSIKAISQSPILKKQLWQTIIKNLL